MPDPYKELSNILEKRMIKHSKNAAFWAASLLGTITDTGLKLDCLKSEIKDYLVADWVFDGEIESDWQVPAHQKTGKITLPAIPTSSGSTVPNQYPVTYQMDDWTFSAAESGNITFHKFNAHLKPVLKSGDRVLVVPVNSGQDFVIICKVVR